MKRETDKKPFFLFWIVIIAAAVIDVVSMGNEQAEVVAGVIITLVVIAVIISKAKKRTGSISSKREHTHDSLDKTNFNAAESVSEHYILQLNSFLKAGIIDKKEYNAILRRYAGK